MPDNLPEHPYDRPDYGQPAIPAPWSPDARRYGFDWSTILPDDEHDDDDHTS